MQNIRRCDNWQAWISSFADSSWHAINLRQPLLRHRNFPWNVFSRFKQISFNYLRFFSVPWWNIRAVAIQIPFVWIRRNSKEATNSIIKRDGKKFRGSANIIPKNWMFNCKWGKNLRRKICEINFLSSHLFDRIKLCFWPHFMARSIGLCSIASTHQMRKKKSLQKLKASMGSPLLMVFANEMFSYDCCFLSQAHYR